MDKSENDSESDSENEYENENEYEYENKNEVMHYDGERTTTFVHTVSGIC